MDFEDADLFKSSVPTTLNQPSLIHHGLANNLLTVCISKLGNITKVTLSSRSIHILNDQPCNTKYTAHLEHFSLSLTVGEVGTGCQASDSVP